MPILNGWLSMKFEFLGGFHGSNMSREFVQFFYIKKMLSVACKSAHGKPH